MTAGVKCGGVKCGGGGSGESKRTGSSSSGEGRQGDLSTPRRVPPFPVYNGHPSEGRGDVNPVDDVGLGEEKLHTVLREDKDKWEVRIELTVSGWKRKSCMCI